MHTMRSETISSASFKPRFFSSIRAPRVALLALATAAASCLAAMPAAAQSAEGFALDRFEPSERGSEWFALDSLDLRGHVRPAIGIVADYAYKPLVLYDASGDEKQALIKHQLFAHLGGSLVLWDRLRLGASLPVALVVDGSSGSVNGVTFAPSNGAHVGDLRVSADVRLVGAYRDPASLAIGASVWLPTGSRDAYTGDGTVRFQPHALLAGEIGPFAYAAKAAFNLRTQSGDYAGQQFGNELAWGLAAGLRLADEKLLIGPELYGSTFVKGDAFTKQGTPTEIILGGHYTAGDVRFGLGAGPGLTRGFGSPEVRILGSFEWTPGIEKAPPPPPADRDGDGILDKDDACPDEPGVESDDPKKNGCPVRDRDGDTILDDVDACPDEKGVKSDDPEKNGCPIHDRDQDGILDDVDACPDEKGEASDDPKKNGCPPPKDTDGDGIVDPEDACPTDPGPRSEDPKKNGCPAARIEKGQIRILEQVQFKTGSDVILPASDGILQAVLTIFKEHAEITKVGVEGHTDNKGTAGYNKTLSKKRAASVANWLKAHGIEPKRLESAGFGFERPLDSNDTEEGRQANRRVEFHIQEIDGKPADTTTVKE
jgi:outer membrane protein OmpA-like peptidoglycan-associated protein